MKYVIDSSLSSEDEDIEPDSHFANSRNLNAADVGILRSNKISNYQLTVFENDKDRIGQRVAADISDDEMEVVGDEDLDGVRSEYKIVSSHPKK